MSTVEELKENLVRAQAEYQDACNRRRETQDNVEKVALQYYKAKLGVEVGTIVVRSGRLYQVGEVETLHYDIIGKPRLHCFPQKKDGSWSRRSVSLWTDWDVATEEQKAALSNKQTNAKRTKSNPRN